MSKNLHILIACGGTGGHLFPGIAVAEAMRAKGHEVMLLISQKKVDAEGSAKYSHLNFKTVPAVAKPATLSPRMLPFLWKTWQSIRQCKAILKEFGADAVLGMGGFTSFPPIVAGNKLGLKTFVHDSNAHPGRANILTSRYCSQVFLGLSPAKRFFPKSETALTGTPVRPEIASLPSRDEAAKLLGVDPSKKTILVTGGSQGARKLNELTAASADLLPAGTQIIHVAGAFDFERVQGIVADRKDYHLLGFCDQMAAAYAVSDLVITRSGASSLTEVAMAGLPSILVPYPYAADDHQSRNAEVFAKAGAAIQVEESELTAEKLANLATTILEDLPTHEGMSKAARSLAIPDAADRVCTAIETTLAR